MFGFVQHDYAGRRLLAQRPGEEAADEIALKPDNEGDGRHAREHGGGGDVAPRPRGWTRITAPMIRLAWRAPAPQPCHGRAAAPRALPRRWPSPDNAVYVGYPLL